MDRVVSVEQTIDASLTIDEWCALRKVSQRSFFRSLKDGSGPRTYLFRGRRYIAAADDAEWLAKQRGVAA